LRYSEGFFFSVMLALELCGDTGGHLLPPSMIHRSIEAPACLHYLPAHIAKLAARGQSFLQGLRPVEMKT
jgi:hypothetical protein